METQQQTGDFDKNGVEYKQCPKISKSAHDAFASMGLNGQEDRVEKIKEAAAVLWDAIDRVSIEPGANGMRYIALAKTSLEESVMWAVKGVSRSKGS